jgi:hypothetical protein
VNTDHKDASHFVRGGIGSYAPTHVNWTTWHDVWLTLRGLYERGCGGVGGGGGVNDEKKDRWEEKLMRR